VSADAGSYGYNRQLVRAGMAGDWGSGHIQASRRESDDYYWQSSYKTDYVDGNLRLLLTDTSDLTFGFEQSDRFKDKHGSVKGAVQARLDPKGRIGRDFTRMYDVELLKLHATYSNSLSEKSNFLATVYEYKDKTFYWSSPQRMTATGATITDSSPGAQSLYTTNNDYDQVQRGFKSEFRSAIGQLGWMAGVDVRRNRYENDNTARVTYCTRMPCANPANVVQAGSVLAADRTDEAIHAAYGELKYLLTPQWTLVGNGRFDHINLDFENGRTRDVATPFSRSKSFGVSSWRGGATYAASKDVDLFGNVSTGFRAPTAQQLYGGSMSPLGGKVRNNESLKPERSVNIEFGSRVRTAVAGVAVDLEGSIYQLTRRDFITASTGQYGGSSAADPERYENIGGVRSRGFELSLRTDRQRLFTLDVAYSYTRSKFTNYDQFNQVLGNPYIPNPAIVRHDNTGNDVPRVPRHQLFTTLGWQPSQGLRFALEMDTRSWSWADEINQEKWSGRTLFNLQANYDVKTEVLGKFSFFARVDNLFDKYYWSAARGTNDAANYLTGAYDNRYDANDLSLVVGKPRTWMVGLTGTF
ncbi:MAG: TonB-dependent receptor, partial [Azospira sp.]|nr:TonB-dependent receptor [Azospira sp.]